MDDSSAAESNPDDEPVTLLRRSARLATKEKYHNDSSSEDTGVEVKEKLKASKDRRGQCQNKAKHSMKKKAKQPRKEPTSDDSDLNQEQQVEESGRRQQKKKSIILRSKVRKTTISQDQPAAASNTKRLLRKGERTDIIKSIKALNKSQLQVEVIQKLQGESTLSKVHLQKFIADSTLIQSLLDYHVQIFVDLYEQDSTGKEKYLRFQINWHTQCSIFLLPQSIPTDVVLTNVSNLTKKLRSLWLKFCNEMSDTDFSTCCKIMITFSSSIYALLLEHIHTMTKTECNLQQIPCDEIDVYYRFGGAILSDMHHARYKSIRSCESSKIEQLSLEIDILHAVNTKDKADMPIYLKYRDRGYMYSPHTDFVPFIREVDQCVKEIVNEKCFLEFGDTIVKVRLLLCLLQFSYFYSGSSFTYREEGHFNRHI